MEITIQNEGYDSRTADKINIKIKKEKQNELTDINKVISMKAYAPMRSDIIFVLKPKKRKTYTNIIKDVHIYMYSLKHGQKANVRRKSIPKEDMIKTDITSEGYIFFTSDKSLGFWTCLNPEKFVDQMLEAQIDTEKMSKETKLNSEQVNLAEILQGKKEAGEMLKNAELERNSFLIG